MYFNQSKKGSYVYLLIYVDDMFIASKYMNALPNLKHMLKTKFEMKDLGPTKRILGIYINRNRLKCIMTLSQLGYILEKSPKIVPYDQC